LISHTEFILHEQQFYFRKGDPDMHMDLYFSNPESARDFIDQLLGMSRFGCVRNKVECSREPERVVMPHAGMGFVHREDYNTHTNPESPEHYLPDMYLKSVVLNDGTRLQMFEQYCVSDPVFVHMNATLRPHTNLKKCQGH
jgi:hypothetical protein